MRNTIIFLICFLIIHTILSSCATTNSKLIISHYNYQIDNEPFRIRSVNSEKAEDCYNELIGNNFIAVDFNQDRIIDRVVMGKVDLAVAQEIYEMGLQLSAGEDKLDEHATRVSQFTQGKPCCLFEIKTFRSKKSKPFNEFIVVEKRNTSSPHTMVGMDDNADGILDKISKGSTNLERMQGKYQKRIKGEKSVC